jgi:hypothetical protein
MSPKKTSKRKKSTKKRTNAKNSKSKVKKSSKKKKNITRLNKDIKIGIDLEIIKTHANKISHEGLSYNECVWLLAEKELKVSNALKKSEIIPDGNRSVNKFVVNPSKIINKPSKSKIQALAQEIFKKGMLIQDLHWLIAEKDILFQQILM